MVRHKSETLTLADIVRSMDDRNDSTWYEVMGIEIPCMEWAGEIEYGTEHEIASQYLAEHGSDRYLVSWPDHVMNQRFNSDASYQLIQEEIPVAQVVGHTPNGREIRQRSDGKYEVQPPNDNWWAVGDTQEEALRKAGWIESEEIVQLREWLDSLNGIISTFSEFNRFSIEEINECRVLDTVPSPWRETAMGLGKCRQEIETLLDRRLSGL